MQYMSLWLILDISLMMIIICLGYICTLACYLTLVGSWMDLNLWDCNSLTSWAISTSPLWWLKRRKHGTIQTYPLTNSILSFMIVILDTQVLFLAKLTHVGTWTPITSGAPNELYQLWASHTSSTTWSRSTPPPKVCYSILELYPKTWVKATQQDVNISRCLNEKWQPHFELKRWVWPMIKWSHLTPKSIYSNKGDFVTDQF